MRNRTVRSILDNAKTVVNAPDVTAGTVFTVLIVTDSAPDAAASNTELALAKGMLEQFSHDQRHTTAFMRVSVSRSSLEVVRGLTLLAVIDQSSINFWADRATSYSIYTALMTSMALLDVNETDLIY